MTMRWRGLMAPDDAKTGDRRAFAPGAITHRKLPLPAEWVRVKGNGHSGAVTVAEIDAVYATEDGMWGTGELLDPMIIPDVTPFAYLAGKRLVGPSVDLDPDMTYTFTPDPDNPEEAIRLITRGNIHSVTFVSTPAFPQVTVEIYDDEEAGALLASAGIECFAVNGANWRSWPIADKATPWSADASIARLAAWSGGDGKKYRQAFLYYDAKSRPDIKETYRLPIADVVNGKLVLIPRAVYQAAAFLSGAHGGVKDIPDNEVQPLQRVVTEIYAVLAQAQEDPQLVPPWQRGGRQGAKDSGAMSIMEEVVVDDRIEQDIDVADEDMTLVASAVDRPPAPWFADPKLKGLTALEVTEGGRVFGHLAGWKNCHKAFRHKCMMAPRSATNYKHFKLGKVLCDDGSMVKVGRVTVGTGHADDRFGVVPAREHYDNTGTCAAVVNVGEDAFGIWVAGALVAGLPEAKAAELRRSPLSGDWRRTNGNLELVGALAVNDPGFEVISEDEAGVYSLTAAGTFMAEPGSDEDCGCTVGEEPRDRLVLLAEVDDVIMNADGAAKMAAWEALRE